MNADGDAGSRVWADAALAAALCAIDPAGLGGVALRARAGPVRDRWLELLRSHLPSGAPVRIIPLHISDGRLLGGLDRLRASGWRGSGYVRWRYPSNRGFLRALAGLRDTASEIHELDEYERCATFLAQLDPDWDRRVDAD